MAGVVYKPSTPTYFNKAQGTKLHLLVENSKWMTKLWYPVSVATSQDKIQNCRFYQA